ncbi:cytokinin dehydrogenase 3-like isoform X2 [Tasmannia lanceolata]|uniref:cytokinin dehydrogenase 3-like isoform X2 n=1 Tax=Tasmannia lanceolata TaxID=3420 RepID=UPI004063290E
MPRRCSLTFFFLATFVISPLTSVVGQQRPWSTMLPQELVELDLAARLRFDKNATTMASTDFGHLTQVLPAAVLYPSSVQDISTLVKSSFSSYLPFSIAARGQAHSLKGQVMAHNGVVIHMGSLNQTQEIRINVSSSPPNFYADVGGEQIWIDVLSATLRHGLSPPSWTDYLYLSVGGTLSNAGISGQTFLHGPQISNVYELDVVTGKGKIVTCSKQHNSKLFYAVLGGLGQFGIITRARIALHPAPQKVKWAHLLYKDFSAFTRDQEHLISSNNGEGFDYVEGSLIRDESDLDDWRSFFSEKDKEKIRSLLATNHLIYHIEATKYYDNVTAPTVDKNDSSYVGFLNRVHDGELKLRRKGLWEVHHPWMNIFVPKSRISDFNEGVFKKIERNSTTGPVFVYPMNQNKWDERMSAVIPEEDVFYNVLFLRAAKNDWEYLEDQNKKILSFCVKAGIKAKEYLPHYTTKKGWKDHFGPKWSKFVERKKSFDPKGLLSPGQKIFTSMPWQRK